MQIVNAAVLAELEAGREVKILLDRRRIVFAYLNVQHAELDRGMFAGDGSCVETVPGYAKPLARRIELRQSSGFPPDAVRDIFAGLRADPGLTPLVGYQIRYGPQVLGAF